MTSKERVIAQLEFRDTDRFPFNFNMARRVIGDYERDLGPDFRVRHYGVDLIETFPLLRFPGGRVEEVDGIAWVREPYLTDWAHADDIVMPDPRDEGVYAHIKANLEKFPDSAILVNIPGPFTVLHGIRIYDNLYLDIYDAPDAYHRLARRIFDVYDEVIRQAVKFPVAAVYFQDDVASSSGLNMSLAHIKEFVFSYMLNGIATAKKAGKKVLYHSDGNTAGILDTLCEMGFDAVNPMQPEYNDFAAFKKRFHGRMGVYGALDNGTIIPYGTPDQIRAHISYVAQTLGAGNGLIFSTSDLIDPAMPRENIDLMVECIKRAK